MRYDAVLIHPPAIYDFREKAIFPGPIAHTVGESTEQFIIPPIGMLSIADYLDRNGYHVIVDNVGERMVMSESFDVEQYLAGLSAEVYAIGLHWCVHCQGAIELARVCKRLHPDATVVLGGLTATVFHEEIIRKYRFVDAVIRGEAEMPFLLLMRALEQHKPLEGVPNLTFRDGGGAIRSEPLMEPSTDLDEFEFTRLDLIEPKRSIFGSPAHWTVPVCRGCLHNCVTCAGSAYSYQTHFGRKKPAFRSPGKIVQDLQKLSDQGVQLVFLFQDPRMGGKEYWSSLLAALRQEKIRLVQLTMELFGPASEEYIRELSTVGVPIVLCLSPESGVDSVRRAQGRNYTNAQLFETIQTCQRYGIPVGVFSMLALGNDTPKTIRETWSVWERICQANLKSKGEASVHFAFGPMVLLDPGSRAFDSPASHGYRLRFKNLEDYAAGMSLPSWHQWLSYETKFLNRDSIVQLTVDSIEHSINLKEKYGLCTSHEADIARIRLVTANTLAIDVVNEAMDLDDEDRRMQRLESLRELLDNKLREIPAPS